MRACILDTNTKICINVTECEDYSVFNPVDAKGNRLPIELAPRHDGEIGWQWTPTGWIDLSAKISTEQKIIDFRRLRDRNLSRFVDSLNPIIWETMPEEKKQEWRDYRQALLDVPQQPGFPDNITWPTKPE